MALDDDARYAAASEEHRHREAIETAADDENGRAGFHATILSNWFSRINYQDERSTSVVRERMGLGVQVTRKTHEALARRVWQTLFDLLIRSAPIRTASLARRGLTPNDSRAVFSLDPRIGRSMGWLADEWQCDPSNATFIVDRLEELGLVSRQPLLNDKRVKLVVLTRKGEQTRAELLQEFHQPPPEFDRLDRVDLEALERIVAKLIPVPMSAVASRRR